MIGIDWGTSSFRAFLFDTSGAIVGRVSAARGIMTIPAGGFAAALHELVGPWLLAGERHVLMAGMVGSRNGWIEAPYLPCPAAAADLAAALVRVPSEPLRGLPGLTGLDVRVVPGLSDRDASGVPEVMRGEETQIAGLDVRHGLVCLPGSHAKWARIDGGRVAAFSTYLSGEAFAAIRAGTILGRTMPDGPGDPDLDRAGFARGVVRAGEPGHLLHHLFGVRTQILFDTLPEAASAAYLSGLLIGHEVRAALPAGAEVWLVGAAPLCALYAEAIAVYGGRAVIADEDAAAHGLAAIGRMVPWD